MAYETSTLGGRIAWAIWRAGMEGQVELARKIGRSKQLINAWVKNRKVPEDESLELIANATEVPVAWLRYGGSPDPAPIREQPLEDEADQNAVDELIRGLPAHAKATGQSELAQLVREVQRLDLEEWQKTWRIAEIASMYRSRERDRLAQAAVIEARAAERRASAAEEHARAAASAEAGALARARIATPPADVQRALDMTAEREATQERAQGA